MVFSDLTVNAQLSGYNLMEYQLGNIPEVKPSDLSTLYEQLNLRYRYRYLKVSLRAEQFFSTDSVKRDYQILSQYQVNYSRDKFEFKAGNIFETLGRGLLLRSYEIPGSILEDRVFRRRQAFYRDVLGFMGKYSSENFMIKILRGKTLNNSMPPGLDNRREDLVEAVESHYKVIGQTLGAIVMRYTNPVDQKVYYGGLLEGNLPLNISYYGEYVQAAGPEFSFLNFDGSSSYGAYLSLNHALNNYGISIEIKAYHNLFLGFGFTDPPLLVKEQSYHLLNRSTHVSNLDDEKGYQVELYYHFPDESMITLNTSRSVNFLIRKYVFEEYFAEYYRSFRNDNTLKLFIDHSTDNLFLDEKRFAGGFNTSIDLPGSWAINFEQEAQFIERSDSGQKDPLNIYSGLNLSRSTRFSAGLMFEFTTDPLVSDRIGTEKIEQTRSYLGANLSYRPDYHNTISVFAGQRRGGPACTSGICYEVLDFSGVELRWNIKF